MVFGYDMDAEINLGIQLQNRSSLSVLSLKVLFFFLIEV